jgi:hypothetical protein
MSPRDRYHLLLLCSSFELQVLLGFVKSIAGLVHTAFSFVASMAAVVAKCELAVVARCELAVATERAVAAHGGYFHAQEELGSCCAAWRGACRQLIEAARNYASNQRSTAAWAAREAQLEYEREAARDHSRAEWKVAGFKNTVWRADQTQREAAARLTALVEARPAQVAVAAELPPPRREPFSRATARRSVVLPGVLQQEGLRAGLLPAREPPVDFAQEVPHVRASKRKRSAARPSKQVRQRMI